MNEPTKEQKDANTIYERLSKEKKLDTIDPAIKILALEYRAYKRANRTDEQKQKKLQRDKDLYYNKHEEKLEYFKNKRNTEEHKAYMKEFRASEAGKKSARISVIKQFIVSDDYDALYDKWKSITHCEDCNLELKGSNNSASRKCIAHKQEYLELLLVINVVLKKKSNLSTLNL